jgi:LuxR family maltose regulon positive regulatory protein
VDEAEFARLPASIAVYRAAHAHLTGDVGSTIAYAGRALDLIRPDDHLGRGSAAGLLALAAWTDGDLDAAHQAWADAMTSLDAAGHVADAVECAIALGDIRSEQGRPTAALRDYERGLRMATEHRTSVVRGAADMHVGMSERFLERDDLDAAIHHLAISKEMGEHLGSRQNPYRWRVAMAGVRTAEDDRVAALALLDEAERLYVGDFYPAIRPIGALRARIWIDQGRLADARAWALAEGLSADDQPDYVRTFAHVTLARLLLAEARRDQGGHSLAAALALLDRLLEAVVAGGRMHAAIEILVLQALANRMRRPIDAALAPLRRALVLAEPEGYVRVFADGGAPMAGLLETLQAREDSSYAGTLLTSFAGGTSRPRRDQELPEPLSARELEVLRLLATDLDGPAIARELVVSVSTIRSHTKAIYGKLGVSSRRAAVRRGDELGLLSRVDRPRGGAARDA